MVLLATGLGIPQHDIVTIIKSPTSGNPISEVTLRKLFAEEIRTGTMKFKLKAGHNLLKLSEKNGAVAIFLAKVRLGFKETVRLEHSGKVEGSPHLTPEQLDTKILALLDKASTREPGNNTRAAATTKPRRKAGARKPARAA